MFQNDLERIVASVSEQAHLSKTPLDCMAMIVLVDQFSRNIYRGTGQMFANDEVGLKWAKHFVGQGWLWQVPPPMRPFAILPFEHHEGLAEQQHAIQLFKEIIAKEPSNSPHLHNFNLSLDYAERHLRVIERFGRFPHRNALLGRGDTEAEAEYLANGGEKFA